MKNRHLLLLVSAFFTTLGTAFGQVVYTENFDSDHSLNWAAFQGGGTDSFADFYFDYGTLGIPAAPNSTNGTTRGLRFLCNQSAGVFQGISASPIGQGFIGNFRLQFDMWLNYNGPLNGGGSGSTQCGTYGVGVNGDSAVWAGASASSLPGIMFGITGDGGSSQDYRCYSNTVHMAPATGVYAAGTGTSPDARNDTATYYAGLGSKTAPAAQLALYSAQTGSTTTGAAGFAWRDVIVEKIDNTVTMKIDGRLIVTCQTPATFSTNIFFGLFDINGTSSTDANDFLICSIFDNIRVTQLGSAVNVTASIPDAAEGGATGEFSFTRTGDTSSALTVNYTLTGTASNGVDYLTLPNSITFAAGETTTNLTLTSIDDSISEFAETAIVTVSASTNYSIGSASATATIADNDTPELVMGVTQPSAYERTPNDYLTFRVSRKGDVNVDLTANIAFTGTATNGVNYSAPATVDIFSGTVNQTFKATVIDDTALELTNLTVIANVDAGTGYNVGTNSSATGTIINDELPAETVLFADDLASDTSTNWITLFGANDGVDDKTVTFGFDLSTDLYPIAPAPNGSNNVLKLTVNKDAIGSAAGVNVYPLGQTFSGDYAVRFDMYLQQNSVSGTTEFATFGINHSGTKTNWNRQSAANVANTDGLPKDADGLWFSVISDGSGSAPGDYCLFTGTNPTNAPTLIKSAAATSFTSIFKKPPFSPGSAAGVPANINASADKVWVNVEVKKIGSLITLSINRTPILTYTNTTSYTSGDIMLGYMDPYDSPGSSGGAVYYSNLRVIDLNTVLQAPTVSNIQMINGGTQVQINFTGATSDSASSFGVTSAAALSTSSASYTTEAGAVITQLAPGSFRATVPVSTATRFYRIKR